MIQPTNPELKRHQIIAESVSMPYNNVFELFETKRATHPEKVFLIAPDKKEVFTYVEFAEEVTYVADFLLSESLPLGSRICLIEPNSSAFLSIYFAALFLGLTVVPINPDLSAPEIGYIINDCDARLVFFSTALNEKVKAVEQSCVSTVSFLCSEAVKPNDSVTDYEEIFRSSSDTRIEDEAVIIYTSGTTGNPKGVVLSHLNLLADAMAISEHFLFDESTRALCILPLFHNNGQITTTLAPLWSGGSVIVSRGATILPFFWQLVEKYSATFSSVMPSILSMLLAMKKENQSLSLKAILCGGQILNESVQKAFETRFKVAIYEGYGLTETTSFSCISDYPGQDGYSGTIGKPLKVNEMAVMGSNCEKLGPGVEGEICIKGLNVASHYLGLTDRNAESFRDGWFHSGDYGRYDDRGYFYFHGRTDALIIRGGENIYPAELENVFYTHPDVIECAAIGIPDDLLGEDVAAFVKLDKNSTVSSNDLKDYCKGRVATFKQPKHIFLVNHLEDLDEIPKGPTKKILYRVLREYYKTNLRDKLEEV